MKVQATVNLAFDLTVSFSNGFEQPVPATYAIFCEPRFKGI